MNPATFLHWSVLQCFICTPNRSCLLTITIKFSDFQRQWPNRQFSPTFQIWKKAPQCSVFSHTVPNSKNPANPVTFLHESVLQCLVCTPNRSCLLTISITTKFPNFQRQAILPNFPDLEKGTFSVPIPSQLFKDPAHPVTSLH